VKARLKVMRKILSVLLIIFTLTLIGCSKSKITVNGDTVVRVGQTIFLEVSSTNKTTDKVDIEIFDENIISASIVDDSTCSITGLIEGKTNITFKLDGIQKTIEIEVIASSYQVIISGENKVEVGKTTTLTATVAAIDNPVITWSSSNDDIATVNNGVVNGLSVGTVEITANYEGATSNFEIEVLPPTLEIVGSNQLRVDDYLRFQAYYAGDEITSDVVFTSSDTNVVIVINGVIMAVGVGEATVYAVSIEDESIRSEIDVEVLQASPTRLSINGSNKVIVGETVNFSVSPIPSSADSDVIWSSRNNEILTVDSNGVVTGVSQGLARLTATSTADESISSDIDIEVILPAPTEIVLTGDNDIKLGSLLALEVDITPSTSSTDLIWESSNKRVAIVSKGKILPLGVGSTTITAKSTVDSSIYGEILINVTANLKEEPTQADLDFVNDIIDGLTLEEKIGQMFIVGFNGQTIPASTAANISTYKFGNYIYMIYNTTTPSGVVSLTTELQNNIINQTGIPAFISIDQEGGIVEKFISGATHFLGNMALAATNDANNAYLVGSAVGVELRNYGINVDFAPVLDVNNNPSNPIIGIRSYSDNAVMVSEFSNQMINGLKSSNVIATAKHFPGHGDTDVDTHYGLPSITHDMDRLYEVELAPFISAIDNGIDAIMTTHIIFDAIDKVYPATLSNKVLTGLLRDELGFDGLIITDGMNMNAIKNNFGYGTAGVLAVQAGVDILTFTESTSASVDSYLGILNAVNSGTITEERIDDSVRRILLKKLQYGLFDNYLPISNATTFDLSAHEALNQSLSEKSLTVAKGDFTGLDKNKSTLIISPRSTRYTLEGSLSGDYNSLAYLASVKLKEKGFLTVDYQVGTSFNTNNIVDLAKDYDQVVVAFENANYSQALLIEEIYKINNDVVAVSLNKPYDLNAYPSVENYICIYEYTPTSAKTLIDFLNGEFEATGILPINIDN